jgi:hypothetical protein
VRSSQRDLLFAACRVAPSAASAGPRLGAGEWRELIGQAEALGVAGHLHAFLVAQPRRGGMGDAEWAGLQGVYYAQGARNAALLAALREVLTAFAQRAIPVLVLKGAALAETVYRNVALRPMRDLDVLVRREYVTDAADVLEYLGFAPDEWYRPREWYLEHLHHLVPYRRGQATVEIHHRLLPPSLPLVVADGELWARSCPAVVAGVPARVLAPDDLVLHLALHLAASDGFAAGLCGVRDLAEALRQHRGEIDWSRLAVSARGLERPVRAALEVAARLLGAVLPATARAALVSGRFGPLEARARDALARRVVVRHRRRDVELIPTWFLRDCLRQVIDRRGWMARSWEVVRGVMASWTRQGRAQGWGRMAPLYALAHPWLVLARHIRSPGPRL